MPTRRGCRAGKHHKLTSVSQQNLVDHWKVGHNVLPCALFNARSNSKRVQLIVDHIIEHDLDLMFLCETWLYGDERDNLYIQAATDGYDESYEVPKRNCRGREVAIIMIMVKSCIRFTRVTSVSITTSDCNCDTH